MKTIFLYLLLILIPSTQILAQNSYIIKETVIGGDSIERYPMIIKSDSGTFILAGQSISDVSFDKTEPLCNGSTGQDLWIVKINADLIPIWDRSIGGEKHERLPFIFQDPVFHNYLISAGSVSDSSCEKTTNNQAGINAVSEDFWISVLDSSGIAQHDFSWGSINTDSYPTCIRLSNGNYLAGGASLTGASGNKTDVGFGDRDYWLVLFDSTENKLWDKCYGGSGTELLLEILNRIVLIEVNPNIIFIFGTSNSSSSGNISTNPIGGNTNFDIIYWVIDSTGTILWQDRFGGTSVDRLSHVIRTIDGGFLLVGSTRSPVGYNVSHLPIGFEDCWIVKLDSVGGLQWERRFGGVGYDNCTCAETAPGGGYFIGGQTESPAGYDISESGYGNSDYWIFLVDSIGNKVWDRRFGGPGSDELSNFVVLSDTSIILSGHSQYGSSPVKANPGYGPSDYWLVHLKYTDTLTTVHEQWAYQQVHLSPNPSSGTLQIPGFLRDASVTISDVTGRGIAEIPVPESTTLDLTYLPNGCYHFRFVTKQGNYYAKWIKM